MYNQLLSSQTKPLEHGFDLFLLPHRLEGLTETFHTRCPHSIVCLSSNLVLHHWSTLAQFLAHVTLLRRPAQARLNFGSSPSHPGHPAALSGLPSIGLLRPFLPSSLLTARFNPLHSPTACWSSPSRLHHLSFLVLALLLSFTLLHVLCSLASN